RKSDQALALGSSVRAPAAPELPSFSLPSAVTVMGWSKARDAGCNFHFCFSLCQIQFLLCRSCVSNRNFSTGKSARIVRDSCAALTVRRKRITFGVARNSSWRAAPGCVGRSDAAPLQRHFTSLRRPQVWPLDREVAAVIR